MNYQSQMLEIEEQQWREKRWKNITASYHVDLALIIKETCLLARGGHEGYASSKIEWEGR
jgi:hypothetical protein